MTCMEFEERYPDVAESGHDNSEERPNVKRSDLKRNSRPRLSENVNKYNIEFKSEKSFSQDDDESYRA